MATLEVQEISRPGLNAIPSGADVAGDEFPNDGKLTFLEYRNATIGNLRVNIISQKTVDTVGLAVADLVVDILAGSDFFIGPFPAEIYNDDNGMIQVTYPDGVDPSFLVFTFRLGV